MSQPKNLSDTRGNSIGIGIFLFFLKLMGTDRTCELVWVVSFFYAVFDRKAGKAASYYLKHRFPDSGPLRRFFQAWKLFTRQGQALVETRAMMEGKLSWDIQNGAMIKELTGHPKGFLLLASHFSCWQALNEGLETFRRPLNLLAAPDSNPNVNKLRTVGNADLRLISVYGPMGGLVEASEALERGEIVCMMGDRCFEEQYASLPFLGEPARFPYAAFYLAARHQCAVVPLFALPRKRHTQFTVFYGDPIRPVLTSRNREELLPYVREYAELLERMAIQHPYRCFLFENIWL